MAPFYQIFIPLLSLFLVRVDLTDLIPLNLPVKVLKIYDGDTLLVGKGSYHWKVRFLKLDAPEKGQPFINGRGDAGLKSEICLKKVLKTHKPMHLFIHGTDMYGRVLGEIEGLSLRLIQEGCSTLYPYARFSSRHEKYVYLRALKKAKASRRGLWQYGGFRQPKIWRKLKDKSHAGRSTDEIVTKGLIHLSKNANVWKVDLKTHKTTSKN